MDEREAGKDRYRYKWMYEFDSGNLKANPFDYLFLLCEMTGTIVLHTWGEKGRFKSAIWKMGKRAV